MFTRSRITPGTVRSSAQGSREFGIFDSSSWSNTVEVPVRLVSMTGDSAVTVIVSSTDATFRPTEMSTFVPVATTTFSRLMVENPVSVAVTL